MIKKLFQQEQTQPLDIMKEESILVQHLIEELRVEIKLVEQ